MPADDPFLEPPQPGLVLFDDQVERRPGIPTGRLHPDHLARGHRGDLHPVPPVGKARIAFLGEFDVDLRPVAEQPRGMEDLFLGELADRVGQAHSGGMHADFHGLLLAAGRVGATVVVGCDGCGHRHPPSGAIPSPAPALAAPSGVI